MDPTPKGDEAYFAVLTGRKAGQCVALPHPGTEPFQLGRGRDATFYEPHPELARAHFALQAHPENFHTISDLQTTNGTFVNGERVRTTKLAEGDLVEAGPVLCRYLRGPGAAERAQAAIAGIAVTDPWTGLPRTAGPDAMGLRIDPSAIARCGAPMVVRAVLRCLPAVLGEGRSYARLAVDFLAVWPADGLAYSLGAEIELTPPEGTQPAKVNVRVEALP